MNFRFVFCALCGKELTKKQKKYCSKDCYYKDIHTGKNYKFKRSSKKNHKPIKGNYWSA